MSKFYAEKQNEYPDIGQNGDPNAYAASSISPFIKTSQLKVTCTTTSRKQGECVIQYS